MNSRITEKIEEDALAIYPRYPDARYPDRIPLSWGSIRNLIRLKLYNPRRARRFRYKIVEFGMLTSRYKCDGKAYPSEESGWKMYIEDAERKEQVYIVLGDSKEQCVDRVKELLDRLN